jgi:hypothetical protein
MAQTGTEKERFYDLSSSREPMDFIYSCDYDEWSFASSPQYVVTAI